MMFKTPKYNILDVNTFNILCMTIFCFFPSAGERSSKIWLPSVIEMCCQNEEQINKVKYICDFFFSQDHWFYFLMHNISNLSFHLAEDSETEWETSAFLKKCWTKAKVVVFKAGNLSCVSVGCEGDLLLLHFCQMINGDHICWCWIVDNSCTSALVLFFSFKIDSRAAVFHSDL